MQVMKQSYFTGYWNIPTFFRTVEYGSTFFGTEWNGKLFVHVTHLLAHELLVLRSFPVHGKLSASEELPLRCPSL